MMTKEVSTKIVNFTTPWAGVLVLGRGQIVNMQYFFSSSCCIRQIMYEEILTKEGSAKIVNFITIGAGGIMLGRHYSEYALFSTLSVYITLIAIVLR